MSSSFLPSVSPSIQLDASSPHVFLINFYRLLNRTESLYSPSSPDFSIPAFLKAVQSLRRQFRHLIDQQSTASDSKTNQNPASKSASLISPSSSPSLTSSSSSSHSSSLPRLTPYQLSHLAERLNILSSKAEKLQDNIQFSQLPSHFPISMPLNMNTIDIQKHQSNHKSESGGKLTLRSSTRFASGIHTQSSNDNSSNLSASPVCPSSSSASTSSSSSSSLFTLRRPHRSVEEIRKDFFCRMQQRQEREKEELNWEMEEEKKSNRSGSSVSGPSSSSGSGSKGGEWKTLQSEWKSSTTQSSSITSQNTNSDDVLSSLSDSHIESIAELRDLTGKLRHTAEEIQHSLRKDSKVLDATDAALEFNLGAVKKENARLSQWAKSSWSDTCMMTVLVAVLFAVFIGMIGFMKIVPAPKY